jgi:CRP-like cAMP-binding protein
MPSTLPSQVLGNSPPRQQFSLRTSLPVKQNCVWRIEAGAVRTLTWLEDGTTITIGIWGPGDVIGQPLTTVNPYQIESLTAAEATLLSLGDERLPSEWLLNHLQHAEALMVIRSYRRVDIMLAKLLAWLAKRFGRSVDQGHLIDLRLTHQDLAELVGTTRVTITRTLGQFEQQGIIERLSVHRILLKEDEVWHYEI